MKIPEYGLAAFIALAGVALIVASRRIASVTDPINERLIGRKYRDSRGYVLVGIGLVIVGVAIVLGLA